jgi:hypothetical protein
VSLWTRATVWLEMSVDDLSRVVVVVMGSPVYVLGR